MTILTKICLAVSLLSCCANAKGSGLGKVLVIDHKWGFMVLNIGLKDGILKDEEMDVNTVFGSRLRIKITRAEETVSIAETIKGFHLWEIAVGDKTSPTLKK